jgi:DNA-binding response OmpR family regulator
MKTLLLLEDQPSLMQLLRSMLTQYDVIGAATADEALRLFTDRSSEVALLVADVTLPASPGIQVAVHLRSEIPALPIVLILTSQCPVNIWIDRDTTNLERLGSNSVTIISRPFQDEVLSSAVRELIGNPLAESARTAYPMPICKTGYSRARPA